jgi:hypothetical protein
MQQLGVDQAGVSATTEYTPSLGPGHVYTEYVCMYVRTHHTPGAACAGTSKPIPCQMIKQISEITNYVP